MARLYWFWKKKKIYTPKNIAVLFRILVKALNEAAKIKFLPRCKFYTLYCAPRCFNAAIDNIKSKLSSAVNESEISSQPTENRSQHFSKMIPCSVHLNSLCLKGLHSSNWDKICGIGPCGWSLKKKTLRFMNLVPVEVKFTQDKLSRLLLQMLPWRPWGRDGRYLKLGADAHSRARQAMSTAAYTSRKKMVTMLAMVLSFPEKRTSWRRREGEEKQRTED